MSGTRRGDARLAIGIRAGWRARVMVGDLGPETIGDAARQGRGGEGVLAVPRAGEKLYRVADAATE